MADIPAANWNEADASNSTPAPDGAPEGMAPSGVNDTMRAMMGATKRWYDWSTPKITAGTSTAYTLAYAVAPGALVDGMSHLVQFNAINGAAPTLNVNGLGALPLHFWASGGWGAFPANMVAVDQVVRVVYNAGAGTYRAIDLPPVLRQSVSGVGAIDFTGIPASVNDLEIAFHITLTANVAFGIQFYISGVLDTAGHYFNQTAGILNGVPSGTVASGTGSFLVGTFGSTEPISGRAWLQNIQNTVASIGVNSIANGIDSSNTFSVAATVYGGRNAGTIGPITGIRLVPASGNESGTVTVVMR